MGMTQCFYAVSPEDIISDTDFRDNHGMYFEFASFSKEYGIFRWMKALWEKKTGGKGRALTEEYLLLNEKDIQTLEQDFRDGKISFKKENQSKEVEDWLKGYFKRFLDDAKERLSWGLVIYYEVRC